VPEPVRRGAIPGLDRCLPRFVPFAGTGLSGLACARSGFCGGLSPGCIAPALIEARRLRRRSPEGTAAA
jgi:hypothetical protein